MAAAAPFIIGAGFLTKAYGDIRQGQTDESVAKYNAALASENANLTRQTADQEARRYRLASRKYIGSQRAAIGVAGVTTEGSPLDALAETAANTELEVARIKYQGELKAQGYGNEQRIQEFRGRSAKTQSYYSAAGDLLGGAGNIAGGIK